MVLGVGVLLGTMLLAVPPQAGVLVLTPLTSGGSVKSGEVVEGLISALNATTDLRTQRLPDDLIQSCKGMIGCIVMRQSGKYRYILVATLVPRRGLKDLLSLVVVDAERARNVRTNVDPQAEDWLQRVELGTLEEALVGTEQSLWVGSAAELEFELPRAIRAALSQDSDARLRLRAVSEPAAPGPATPVPVVAGG